MNNNITYELDNIVIWNDGTKNTAAWVDGGSRCWNLTPEEEKMPTAELYNKIKTIWQNGQIYRCTGCNVEIQKEEVAGWPLFAGCACQPCWIKHLASLEEERKKGHVCGMCGKPYGACYC